MKRRFSFSIGVAMFLAVLNFVLPVAQTEALADLGDPDFSTLQFRNRWVAQDRLVGAPGVD